MKKAWIENDIIRDVAHADPSEIYHPDVAVHYSTDVPDDAENGDTWKDGVLTKPPVLPAVAPMVEPPTIAVSPVEFKLLFTAQERIAIKTSTDPVVQDFFDIISDPRLTKVVLSLSSTTDALDYLTVAGILAPGRKAEIVTGGPFAAG